MHAQLVLTITQDFATKLFEINKIFITLSKPFIVFQDLFQTSFKFIIEKSIIHVDDFISMFVAKSITNRKLLILENYIMKKNRMDYNKSIEV